MLKLLKNENPPWSVIEYSTSNIFLDLFENIEYGNSPKMFCKNVKSNEMLF